MICFICNSNLPGIQELKSHFILTHKFSCTDPVNGALKGIFVCKEGNCNSSFTLFSSFQRHVSCKHSLNPTIDKKTCENVEIMDVDVVHENIHSFDNDPINKSPQFEKVMTSELAKMLINKIILEMRCKTTIPESTVGFLISAILKIVVIISTFVQVQFMLMLESLDLDTNNSAVRTFLSCLDFVEFFKNTETFQKQIRHNIPHLDYIAPDEIFLGQRIDTVIKDNINSTKVVKETFQYFPITKTLRSIFKFTNLLQLIRQEPNTTFPSTYSSYLDGEEYLNHPFLQKNKDVVRINLYYDDIDVCNPIGSQSAVYKVACFYFTIQNAGFLNSQLENIFILAIAYNTDVKKYGFQKILEPFIKEMKLLETDQGIPILINNQTFELKATLTAFVGDSLAAHDILGFVSPSGTHFCRQCMITQAEFRKNPIFNADERNISTHTEQLEHLKEKNFDKKISKMYGVKEDSPLNSLQHFHCTTNFVFDPMHDLLEGVVPFTIKHILKKLIQTKKIFSVFDFNQRVDKFRYGASESANKPSANFTLPMLNSSSGKLKQKSTQSWLLLRVFPFLIGHLLGEEDLPYLQLTAKLTKICSIVFAPEVFHDAVCDLDRTVTNFLLQFKELFGDQIVEEELVEGPKMIFKGHWLRHYAYNMLLKGPPSLYSCMRFEGKHYPIKQQIAASHNYINVPKSIAKRQSLLQAFNIKYNCYNTQLSLLSSFKYVELESLSFGGEVKEHLGITGIVKVASACTLKNTDFRQNFVIRIEDDSDLPFPNHVLIKNMLEVNGKIYFYCKKLQTLDFDEILYAFEVQETEEIICLDHCSITDYFPRNIWQKYGEDSKFISAKYSF
jgi:hypothetical protein